MFVLIEFYDGDLAVCCAHESKEECRKVMMRNVKECIGEDYLFEDYHETCVEHYIPSKDETRVLDQSAGYDIAGWNDHEAWFDGSVEAKWSIEEIR